MSGKLARIEAQELAMIAKMNQGNAAVSIIRVVEFLANIAEQISGWFQVPDVVQSKKSKPQELPKVTTREETANKSDAKRKTKKKRHSENDEVVSKEKVVEDAPNTDAPKPTKKRKHATSCEEAIATVSNHKKSKKNKVYEKDVPAVASDFLKSPEKEVVLTEAQIAKQERKRQRQMKRLAKQMGEELQID